MASTCWIDLHTCGATRAALAIPHSNLLAVASEDSIVRVYKHDTDGNEFLRFKRHLFPVLGLVHLDGDIVASIDSGGNLYSWNATNGTVLGNTFLKGVVGFTRDGLVRLSPTAIAVKSKKGSVRILKHTMGRTFILDQSANRKTDYSKSICGHHGKRFVVTGRMMKCVQVQIEAWDKSVRFINHSDNVECIAVNDKFIVAACVKGKIFLRRNGGNYDIISSSHIRTWIPKFNPSPGKIQAVSFVSSSLLMLNTLHEGIFFLSVPTMVLIGRIGTEVTGNAKCYTAIMGDARICIGSKTFCCILDLPPQIQSLMKLSRQRISPAPVADGRMEGGNTHRPPPAPGREIGDPATAEPAPAPSLPRKRNREELGSVEMMDFAGKSSKKTARLESERGQLTIEELKKEVAKQGVLIESINKKRKDVKKAVRKAKLRMEEQERERESLKNAADVREVEIEEMHGKIDGEKKRIEKLEKKVLRDKEERQAGIPPNPGKRDEMVGMQSQLDDLRTVLQQLLFQNAMRGGK